MKLSEAIRLGATMRPQVYGFYYHDGKTCALGAAYEACGRTPAILDQFVLVELFGPFWFESGHSLPCPACSWKSGSVFHSRGRTITHLNDDHQWTREQIADFVELHEPLPTLGETVVSETPSVKEDATAPAVQI